MSRIVLLVHQSAEMYGSDKVLLHIAEGLDPDRFKAVVLLPEAGPLMDELLRRGIEVHVVRLLKVGRALFSFKGLIAFPWHLFQSCRDISSVMQGRKVDLVHTNTLAVLSSPVWALFNRVPSLWHVHEILLAPSLVRTLFPLMVKLLAGSVVCNSKATQEWLIGEQPSLRSKSVVIWNGLPAGELVSDEKIEGVRREIANVDANTVIALVGRINAWKGHLLLVESAEILLSRGVTGFEIVMIGDVFKGQEHFRRALEERIKSSRARSHIRVLGFRDDIQVVWRAVDVAVVPSTEPEPFGMVAIEAMAAGKPVVAANHGGLSEIVVHGETGLLFEPNSAQGMADALESLIGNKARQGELGRNGMARQDALFSTATQVRELERTYESLLADKCSHA